mgnify:CR=1 FL=1
MTERDDRFEPASIDVDRAGAVTIGFLDGEVARFDLPVRRFLKPRIGARPGSQQACLDIFAAAGDVHFIQYRKHLVFGHAWMQRALHLAQRPLADVDPSAHAGNLVG